MAFKQQMPKICRIIAVYTYSKLSHALHGGKIILVLMRLFFKNNRGLSYFYPLMNVGLRSHSGMYSIIWTRDLTSTISVCASA